MIAWTPDEPLFADDPTRGEVKVGPWPDKTRWSKPYFFTVGACFLERHNMPIWQRVALMFTDFHQLVVSDGIDPTKAHAEFCKIAEYRAVISPDIEGADPDAVAGIDLK
jgi:hypothetical protein